LVPADLVVAAILDLAKRPIEVDAWLAWVEELLVEEGLGKWRVTPRGMKEAGT
jgi:hypothetical protein